MADSLYPLKFEPILKDEIWGGEKLNTILKKQSSLPNTGQSWEISDLEGFTSKVSNGALKGVSLKVLLENYGAALLGEKNYQLFGNKFPLLIKFIDAKQDLSIQLHPNDELAAIRHDSFGKTEMWYVLQADEDAKLIVGFNQEMTTQKYLSHLKNKTLTDIVNFDKVKAGDTYFIEAGRIHAIGAGVLLAEIQQTSNITYRVYDWDRVDEAGNERELHNDLAIDSFDFNMPDNFKVQYDKIKNQPNEMVSCKYFTTNYLEVNGLLEKENTKDSFFIYICVEGRVKVSYNDTSELIHKGETILIPAAIKNYKIDAKEARLLEVYV